MYFSDRMAEIIKEELNLDEFEIKEEIIYSHQERNPSRLVYCRENMHC